MRADDVTVGEGASRYCESVGLDPEHVKHARAHETSSRPGHEHLLVFGTTPLGEDLIMRCRNNEPTHIVTVRYTR